MRVETFLRLVDKPPLEPLFAAPGLGSRHKQHGLPFCIEGEGHPPLAVRRTEPQFLHVRVARVVERVHPRPAKVAGDPAYRNARENSDRQNARIEHDEALRRVMTAVIKDDMQLFKQFTDNESFRRWMTDNVFGLTYSQPQAKNQTTVRD